MKARVLDVLSVGVFAAAAAASFLVYDRLPERMATHFDIHGQANGWMPRPWGAYFLPAFGLAIWGVVRVAGRFAPNGQRKGITPGVLALLSFLLAGFLAALHVVVLRAALAPTDSIMRPVWILAGLFYIALGILMPRLRQNAVAGVRTMWTLSSPEVWAKTQRVGGYAMCLGGVAIILAGLVGGEVASIFAFSALILSAVVPVAYSFLAARAMSRN